MQTKFFYLVIIGCIISAATMAQTDKRTDSLTKYFSGLAKSAVEGDKVLLEHKLYELLNSEKEDDWILARNFFFQLNKRPLSSFIAKAAMLQFPLGKTARSNQLTSTVTNETDPVKKETAYKKWLANFPPARFNNETAVYENAQRNIAVAYAKAGNVKKAKEYAGLITSTTTSKLDAFAEIAAQFAQNEHQQEAVFIYKNGITEAKKIESAGNRIIDPIYAEMGIAPPPPRYISYSRRLAAILLEQKKYDEALGYIKFAHDSIGKVDVGINSLYLKILLALQKEQEAFDIIDETVKSGQATDEIQQQLKGLYVKVKGSEQGYADYLSNVNRILKENMRKELAMSMIKQPAKDFKLTDVDGNEVTLSSLKGKTVILDFWATWCKPCIKSFPAMKLAVEKYKDNPDVKFIFIHTWEREENATDSARIYIRKNNYPFQVLMDLKDADGHNRVVESYGVQGIPTKFLVDKNGYIRFKFVGFKEGEEAAVEEITAMIELAQN